MFNKLKCPHAELAQMNPENSQIQKQLTTWLLRRTPNGGVRRVAPLVAAIASEIGCVRQDNQDRAAIVRGRDNQSRDYVVLAIADGIGGMRDGATCAALNIATFVAALDYQARQDVSDVKGWIRHAVLDADRAVFEQFRGDGGSTLVALVIRPGHDIHWVSVGDSRVYSTNGSRFAQVSIDDTIAGQLGKDADAAFGQSKLLQFIGMGAEIEVHIGEFGTGQVDAVVLTTDGIHYLSPTSSWLGQIVSNASDPGVCVKRLVELANWCGGPDNATVAMISLASVWESGERPDYPCLEVWDAFGELQIISEHASRTVLPVESNNDLQRTAVPIAPLFSETEQDENSTTPKSLQKIVQDKGKQNLARPKRSVSRRKNKNVGEMVKTDSTQFLMVFPAKSTR